MPENIGRYRIEGVLGHGAMGVVYRGVDAVLERPVAIKTIHPHLLSGPAGEELFRRFKTEATAAARCQHANIVTVYEFNQQGDMPYIAMEFIDGRGLDSLLKENPALPLKRINAIMVGVCRGLHYAHKAGIIHRDIKPANIMVLANDGIKLADFGIAKLPTSDQTQIGMALGTPSYMSPEQRVGDEHIDARADIFALGVILFELLSASIDLPAGDYVVEAVGKLPPTPKLMPKRNFPQSIASFLSRCLQPRAQDRFDSVATLMEAYKSALKEMQFAGAADATISTRPPQQATVRPETQSEDEATIYRSSAGLYTQPMKAVAPEPEPESEEAGFIKKSLTALEATRALKAVDPVLNADWRERVEAALATFDDKGRERAYDTIVVPKNIQRDANKKGKLVYLGHPTLQQASIGLSTPDLSQLAEKLIRSIEAMRRTRVVMQVADILEGGVNAIDRLDTEDNLGRQQEKNKLRMAFLYAAAESVHKLDIEVPENRRGLTQEMIKAFILDVFIKQQVMKYWFSTTPLRTLEADPNPLISKLLVHEAQVRRLDVVMTDRFFFLIGSVPRIDQNPFSIRRFLVEDTLMGGQIYFFNVSVVDRARLQEPAYEKILRHILSKMVSIERQLSVQVSELVAAFETYQRKYLLPLLFKPIEADGTNLEVAIDRRLQDYERNLCRLALGKVPPLLRDHVRGQDDFEYLISGLKALLLELLGNVQDFSYLSTSIWSDKAKDLEYRIASYIKLMEKRNDYLLQNGVREPDPDEEPSPQALAMDTKKPLAELKKAVNECAAFIERTTARQKAAAREAAEQMNSTFFSRLLKANATKVEDPEAMRKEMDEAQRKCYLEIVRIPKKYPKITIYLEFEDLAQPSRHVRHYAFPAGDLGLGLLPTLAQLPEKREDFVPRKLKEAIEFDVFKTSQRWDDIARSESA